MFRLLVYEVVALINVQFAILRIEWFERLVRWILVFTCRATLLLCIHRMVALTRGRRRRRLGTFFRKSYNVTCMLLLSSLRVAMDRFPCGYDYHADTGQ